MTRLKTSRPSSSVPNGYVHDGLCAGGKFWARGLCGAISGAKIAITIHAAAITTPVIASGPRNAVGSASRRRRGASTATPLIRA